MASLTLYIDGTIPDHWIKWATKVLKDAGRTSFLLSGVVINGHTLTFSAFTDGVRRFPPPTIARLDVTTLASERIQVVIDYAPPAGPIIDQLITAVRAAWPDCRAIDDQQAERVSDQSCVLPKWVQSLNLSARDQDFVRVWNEYPSVTDLADHLSLTRRTVSNRASELRKAYPKLLPLLPYRGNLKTR